MNLYFADDPSAIHPAGHVDGVAPDVVLRLLGPDDAGHYGTDVDADPDLEVVEGVLVDVVELLTDSGTKKSFMNEKVQAKTKQT